MHTPRLLGLLLFVLTGFFFSIAPVIGDETTAPPASLDAIHKLLQQAGGYQADAPPPPAKQTELLNQANKMISDLEHAPQTAPPPRGYFRQLRDATRSINAALQEIGTGDTAHKAKGDIFDADDIVKSLM